MTAPRTQRLTTRRAMFRTTLGTVVAATTGAIRATPPLAPCPELDWVAFGQWTRHQHTQDCRHG